MSILRIKSPPLSEAKKEEKERPKKSRWFFRDSFYKDKRREEEMKDPDFKAFYRDKW